MGTVGDRTSTDRAHPSGVLSDHDGDPNGSRTFNNTAGRKFKRQLRGEAIIDADCMTPVLPFLTPYTVLDRPKVTRVMPGGTESTVDVGIRAATARKEMIKADAHMFRDQYTNTTIQEISFNYRQQLSGKAPSNVSRESARLETNATHPDGGDPIDGIQTNSTADDCMPKTRAHPSSLLIDGKRDANGLRTFFKVSLCN